MAGAQSENGHTDEIQKDRRNVHHIVRPIAPARKKSVEGAKDFLGPEINAALARVTLGEFDDRNSLRPEKKGQRNHPKPNGDAAIRCNRWQHVQIENGNNEQKHQIPLTQNPFQKWLGFGGTRFLRQRFSPKVSDGARKYSDWVEGAAQFCLSGQLRR